MTQARFYQTNGLPVPELAAAATDFFRRDNYDAGFYTDYAGRTILQIGKQGGARFIMGLAYSLTVIFTPQPEDRVLVELGGESWGDKIASGAIGAFLVPPLLLTAAYGAWQQTEMDNRFWSFLDGYIYNRTGRPANPVLAVPVPAAGPQPPAGNWPEPPEGYYAPPPPPPGAYGPAYPAYQNPSYGYAPQGASQPPYPAPWPQSGAPYPIPQRSSWFDPQTMQPVFEQQVGKMASWQAIMADGVINYQELNEQQTLVDRLQQQAEEMLDTNARLKLAETMNELGRLEQLQRTALTRSYRQGEPQG